MSIIVMTCFITLYMKIYFIKHNKILTNIRNSFKNVFQYYIEDITNVVSTSLHYVENMEVKLFLNNLLRYCTSARTRKLNNTNNCHRNEKTYAFDKHFVTVRNLFLNSETDKCFIVTTFRLKYRNRFFLVIFLTARVYL